MTERWVEYFSKQGAFGPEWLRHAVDHWQHNEILLGMIQRYFKPGSRILDVGCGPGFTCCYLASSGFEVTGVDSDPTIVGKAKELSTKLGIPVRYQQGNAFSLTPFHGAYDLVMSSGVLEHFDRQVTIQLLQEQARCADHVLIAIPTAYTRYAACITDERIYDMNGLKRIVADAGLTEKSHFGFGDVTVTASQIWLRRVLPRGLYRMLQNSGYAFSIAVLAERTRRQEHSDQL
jgi:SAM-dependent methyltransferase